MKSSDRFDNRATPTRYLTADTPGIGGRLKERETDFFVEELPLYQPSGSGEHIYLLVEKRGLTSREMVRAVAKHFGVRDRDIGTAGMKDKLAVTRQVVSVHTPGKRAEDFPSLTHDSISILWADQHENKLRRGHLSGNRFSIRVRGVEPTAAIAARRALDTLERVGLPDRVGPQRFGDLGNNHLVGRALIRRDHETAIALLLGPSDASPPNQTEARAAFEAGEFEPARRLMPRWCDAERAALAALAAGETPEQAVDAIDPSLLGFFLSAFQSAVFNRVLDDRLEAGTLDQLLEGDVAVRIAKGVPRGTFAVDDVVLAEPETEPRLRAFEIGPTGPMWGAGMARAAGAVDQAEIDALAGAGLRPEDLAWLPELRIEMTGGTRRPLRVPVTSTDVEGGVDEHGPYVRCAFDLPRGAFATAVMAEIMKATDDQDPAANPGARPDAT